MRFSISGRELYTTPESDNYEVFGAPISPSRQLSEPEAGRNERPNVVGKSQTV